MFEEILNEYRDGKLSKEEAEEKILRSFYEDSDSFLLDLDRDKRLGFPEIVLAEGKTTKDLLDIVDRILDKKDIVFISNVSAEKQNILQEQFYSFIIRKAENMMVIKKEEREKPDLGTVGVITGGSSDVPYAEDCSLLLEELGAMIDKSYDRGISGIHRPYLSFKDTKEADVLIVFAGMDGVLPGLIGSATDKPIIAVPTPFGYGKGGKGEGALTTMLQSCVPGLTVVNIGNFVGAAAAAVRILKSIKN